METTRSRLGRLAAVVLGASLLLCGLRAASGRAEPAQTIGFAASTIDTPWQPGSAYGPWYSVYTGYGVTRVVRTPAGTRALSLLPRKAAKPAETFAALVRTQQAWKDVEFLARLRTVAQLRKPRPNAWETGWVLWHYRAGGRFYYFAAKPNGWELGKEDPAYPGSQRYLATSSTPKFPVGHWYRVRVRQQGATMTVWVGARRIVTFTDGEHPYRSGAIALYSEDASVLYGGVTVRGL
jgi:hypothetical protein